MARVVLEIIQKLTGARSAEDAQKSLDSLVSTAKNATVAVAAMGATFKQAFELAKEGASLNQLEESFERMNAQVFKTPDLLEKMSAAARGTIKDTDLMAGLLTLTAGASDEMSRRFAEAAPQLLEIAKASNKLNPALGDTSFLFQSIATGIKRGSPLILDNLGLTIKVGEANERMAESLGKTVQELSAEEKVMAILNETLRSGDQLIQQVGGNVDSQADSFAQLEVAVGETADRVKQYMGQQLGPLITETLRLVDAIDRAGQAGGAAADLDMAVAQGLVTQKEATRIYAASLWGIKRYQEQLQELRGEVRHGAELLHWANNAVDDRTTAEERLANRLVQSKEAAYDWALALGEADSATIGLIDSTRDVARATDAAEKEVVKVRDALGRTAEEAEDLKKKYDQLNEATARIGISQGIGRAFLEAASGGAFFNESLEELGERLVVVGGRTFQQNKDLRALQNAYDRAADTLHEYEIGLRGAGLSSDELGEAMQVQRDEMTRLAAIMQPLKDHTGQLVGINVEATWNQSALNQELLQAAANADASAVTIARLALATGEMSEEQAEAALRSAIMQEKIQALGEQVAAGDLSIQGAVEALRLLKLQIDQDYDLTVNVHYNDPGFNLDPNLGNLNSGGLTAQHGADFIVPPGFNADNFLMGVSSGERVTVTPANQTHIDLSGMRNDFNISGGGDARAIADEVSMRLGANLRHAIRGGRGNTGRAI